MEDTVRVLTIEGTSGRLDHFVVKELSGVSRSQIQRLIRQGLISVNGHAVKPGYLLREGDQVKVLIPADETWELVPVDTPVDVLYDNEDVIIVNKPAGMPVHPSYGHRRDTLLNALLAQYPDLNRMEDKLRPGIVHRLDMDTSGVLVVARNEEARLFLQAQFKARTTKKVYVALVEGHLTPRHGAIEAPIGRDPKYRRRMAVVRKHGKEARTEYRVQEWVSSYTLLEVRPLTGRTHQIRVHLASIGHPVAGDAVYGSRKTSRLFPRHFLHAQRISIILPGAFEQRSFEAELAEDLQEVLDKLRAETPLQA
ncbi:MAG: RluA family pseudouridine synthase [Chloroflexota bacterium]